MSSVPSVLLVDAVVLRDLFCGRRPAGHDWPAAVAVSWPEYFLLLRSVMNSERASRPPLVLRSLSHGSGDAINPSDWIAALLDPHRVEELHGTRVTVVVPQPQHVAEVVVAMYDWSLDEREAVNLVVAASEPVHFVAASSTVSRRMRSALDSLHLPYQLLSTE